MRLKFFALIFTVSINLLTCQLLAHSNGLRCLGGGEGGVPFILKPNPLQIDWRPLTTHYSVRDFVIHDFNCTLIYGSDNRSYRSLNLFDHSDVFTFEGSDTPISKVLDPTGRYLISEPSSTQLWWFDRNTHLHSSLNIPGPNRETSHLFWDQSNLYTALIDGRNSANTVVSIVRNDLQNNTSVPVCEFNVKGSWGVPGVVRGTAFPKASFYFTTGNIGRVSVLRLLEIDVRSCETHFLENGPEVNSPIRAVYEFSGFEGHVVLFAPPQNNIFWWNDTGCKYINTQDHELVAPSTQLPMLLGLSKEKTLALFDLNKMTQLPIGRGLKPLRIEEHSVGLSRNNLWVSSQFNGEGNQSLIEILLPN